MRLLFPILLAFASLVGCVKRTITITSNPEGALVWVNEREVGRTPLHFDFIYYGEYDLRVELDEHEPIMTTAWTQQPLWDAPFVDFVADVAPASLNSNTLWHFELGPPRDDAQQLLGRAITLRSKTLDAQAN